MNGRGGFEDIVNNTEETVPKTPLLIKDYISYDEMPISALVSASVPTFFINSGSRTNYAQKSRVKNYQEKGIYTGCVGARLEKPVPSLKAHLHFFVAQFSFPICRE